MTKTDHHHNRILKLVYLGEATNRAALATQTGLTKPTISKRVKMLLDEGFLVEGGYGQSSDVGGKRPRILEFQTNARQVIGLDVNKRRVRGVLTNLEGYVLSQHLVPVNPNDDLLSPILHTINGLKAQLSTPLLGIGVGIPAILDDNDNIQYIPRQSWRALATSDLKTALTPHLNSPLYLANSTELAAWAHYVFFYAGETHRHLTVHINDTVGIGAVFGGDASANIGSDIGAMPLSLSENTPTLEERLGWEGILTRTEQLLNTYPGSHLTQQPLSYPLIHWAASRGDTAALILRDELAQNLAHVFQWSAMLFRPQTFLLSGYIANMGETFLQEVLTYAEANLPQSLIQSTTFGIDDTENLVALGAAAHVIQMELELT